MPRSSICVKFRKVGEGLGRKRNRHLLVAEPVRERTSKKVEKARIGGEEPAPRLERSEAATVMARRDDAENDVIPSGCGEGRVLSEIEGFVRPEAFQPSELGRTVH